MIAPNTITTLQHPAWERRLLSLAREARDTRASAAARPIAAPADLARAYAHCEAVTREHSRSFHLASALLPAGKRRAVRALYAFCRTADDIVDAAEGDAEARAAQLGAWRRRALAHDVHAGDPVALAWADARLRFAIPTRYAEQLVDGVARDLRQTRYNGFDELATYAYGVASTVGLMSMHITGFAGPHAIPYAVKLGVALQLTNILRDVGEDWRAGRVYLPAAEMAEFELGDADLGAGRVDARWRAFMRAQIDRNRRLYAEAWPGIALLHRDGRTAIAAAAQFYRGILDDIEAHDYDVFSRRAHVGAARKLAQLPGIWLRNGL